MNTPVNIEVLVFSGQQCSVCTVLKPKVIELINDNFPSVEYSIVDIEQAPQVAAQHSVFTLPVIIVKVDKKESQRFVGSFSIVELKTHIERIISLSQ